MNLPAVPLLTAKKIMSAAIEGKHSDMIGLRVGYVGRSDVEAPGEHVDEEGTGTANTEVC